jgi:DNA-binding PadR family transcriptional regulator
MPWASADRQRLSGSPLQGVLLALLLDEQQVQPLHAYKLATLVERRLGPAWGLTRQSVYGALERLEKDRLVSSALKTQPDRRGPRSSQRVYSASGRAQAALAGWMESTPSREPMRVELQAKIAVSRAKDAPHLLHALDFYEQECVALLRETDAAKVPTGSWAGLTLNLQREAVDAALQAELTWISKARKWIMEFLAENAGDSHR